MTSIPSLPSPGGSEPQPQPPQPSQQPDPFLVDGDFASADAGALPDSDLLPEYVGRHGTLRNARVDFRTLMLAKDSLVRLGREGERFVVLWAVPSSRTLPNGAADPLLYVQFLGEAGAPHVVYLREVQLDGGSDDDVPNPDAELTQRIMGRVRAALATADDWKADGPEDAAEAEAEAGAKAAAIADEAVDLILPPPPLHPLWRALALVGLIAGCTAAWWAIFWLCARFASRGL